MVSLTRLSLPDINAELPLGVVYNSRSATTYAGSIAPRWTLALGAAVP
ncbi:hypothetical protein [Arthrobacter sp. A5]